MYIILDNFIRCFSIEKCRLLRRSVQCTPGRKLLYWYYSVFHFKCPIFNEKFSSSTNQTRVLRHSSNYIPDCFVNTNNESKHNVEYNWTSTGGLVFDWSIRRTFFTFTYLVILRGQFLPLLLH